MLTFFRRIRKSLFDKGAARRYLLYAAGEVLLVMAGILLALQVNNWNEWRKDRIIEEEILQDLANNIQRNIEIIESGLTVVTRQNRASEIIINALENKQPYADSLDAYFWHASLRGIMQGVLSYDGYEVYKNAGFNIIQSDELKKIIVNLFEVIYKREAEVILIHRGVAGYKNLWSKYFRAIRSRDELSFMYKPVDYQTLLGDNEAFYAFQDINFGRNWLHRELLTCLTESNRVLQLIEDEMGE